MQGLTSRLQDPYEVLKDSPERLSKLQAKLSNAITKLAVSPKNGGNPFIFSLVAPKRHTLLSHLNGQEFKTAATDGKQFFWSPEFLEKLTLDETIKVVIHESLHVVFLHCSNLKDKNIKIWNIAVDYVVNSIIEEQYLQQNSKSEVWTSGLGKPLRFQQFLDLLKKQQEISDIVFSDMSLLKRGSDSIYDEIMLFIHDNKLEYQHLPGGMDQHINPQVNPQEVMQEVMAAEDFASKAQGFVPGAVKDQLSKLVNPSLSWQDLVRHALQRKQRDIGEINDWKRFRRRPLGYPTPLYIPRKCQFQPRAVCLLDTSGSMSQHDLVYGISQLKALGRSIDIDVVPVDAAPHWDAMTKCTKLEDLQKIKIVGRGGTVFNQFFEEMPHKIGYNYDVLIVITDGYFGTIPAKLAPPMDVVWVLTANAEVKPRFGRVVPLRK